MADVLVEWTRRDQRDGHEVVESVHGGHVVVVDDDGRRVAHHGDPEHLTVVRSTVKPFQAAACLRLLGPAAADLTGEEIAVSWASHRAEAAHLAAVRDLLARSGTAPTELTCPPPDDAAPGTSRERIDHNCSGKHALFALAGRHIGCPADRLLDPDGPLQRHVLDGVAAAVGRARAVTVDGCGAPAVAVPLDGLARGFARLTRDAAYARVVAAGLDHPDLIGGTGRAETAMLRAGVIGKPGAEGVFAATWSAGGRRLAAAVKIADGAGRAAAAFIVALVAASGGLPVAWTPPPPLGGGVPAGSIRVRPDALRALTPV